MPKRSMKGAKKHGSSRMCCLEWSTGLLEGRRDRRYLIHDPHHQILNRPHLIHLNHRHHHHHRQLINRHLIYQSETNNHMRDRRSSPRTHIHSSQAGMASTFGE